MSTEAQRRAEARKRRAEEHRGAEARRRVQERRGAQNSARAREDGAKEQCGLWRRGRCEFKRVYGCDCRKYVYVSY